MPLFRRREQSGPDRLEPSTPAAKEDGDDWRAFGPISETYARLAAPNLGAIAGDLVTLLEVMPRQRVLDVGTGTGAAARAAASAAREEGLVVGIDPAVGMLRAAARDGGRFAAATAIDLPFRESTFDHVLANFVIAFFPNYATALFDMLRVLKPGGRIGVTWWAAGDARDEFRRTWREVAEEFAEHEILADALERSIPWEQRFGDRAALKETLHEAGVRDIWTEEREYRFEMSREDWLDGREISLLGRFLRQMLGPELWGVFQGRVREVFAERFPSRLNDFRQVNLAVGHKP